MGKIDITFINLLLVRITIKLSIGYVDKKFFSWISNENGNVTPDLSQNKNDI